MPESDGPPLIDRLVATRPDIRVMYMSGYTGDTIAHRGVLDDQTPFLQKPFGLTALVQQVREVLDARPRSPQSA
jgi:DNA-binding NtrC family response regulator